MIFKKLRNYMFFISCANWKNQALASYLPFLATKKTPTVKKYVISRGLFVNFVKRCPH